LIKSRFFVRRIGQPATILAAQMTRMWIYILLSIVALLIVSPIIFVFQRQACLLVLCWMEERMEERTTGKRNHPRHKRPWISRNDDPKSSGPPPRLALARHDLQRTPR
jgi:hypothetical protein